METKILRQCFICSNNCVSPEIAETVLELQGMPNTIEDKLNILKILCQLTQVKWESIESLVKDNFIFPFCLPCLKVIIQIICLREQLFTIERDIANCINHIQTSVAKVLEDGNSETADVNQDEVDIIEENAHEGYKRVFQTQIIDAIYNKQSLQKQTEDQINDSTISPKSTLVEVQKIAFEILNCENTNADRDSGTDKSPISTTFDIADTEKSIAINIADIVDLPLDNKAEYILNLVNSNDEKDDSDHGLPSKKIKLVDQKSASKEKDFSSLLIGDTNGTSDEDFSDADWSSSSQSSSDSDSSMDSESSEEDSLLILGETSRQRRNNKNQSRVSESTKPLRGRSAKGKKLPLSKNTDKKGKVVEVKASLPVLMKQEFKTYKGKDKTEWSTQPSRNQKRKIIRKPADGGLVGAVKNPKLSPVELFKFMFCPKMVNTIVSFTNQYAESVVKNKKPAKKADAWKPLSSDELYAYIGILLYLGLEKKRHVSVREAWNKDPKYIMPNIIATMALHRFLYISKYLRFDDRVARGKIIAEDAPESKLRYISNIFDPFVKNIQAHFTPYDNLVVDEMLVKYRGKVKFRVYIKSKPGKYGMKIWVLCDAKTKYVLRLCIYEGKVGDNVETELGKKVVLGLVENYFESGRTVTTDNFFTSKSLGNELLKRNMKLLGTLNKNRMDSIPEFIDGTGRLVESSIFAFQEPFTMVSYVPRKNRTVLLMSTAHSTAEINPEIKKKPQMILDYNATKGGVDTVDQMIGNYTCQRATGRWPVKLFQTMCDIGALNAYTVWKIHRCNDSTKSLGRDSRRVFLRLLCEGLMDPQIIARSTDPQAFYYHSPIKSVMALMGHPVPDSNPVFDKLRLTIAEKQKSIDCGRRKCHIHPCKSGATRTKCTKCKKYVCLNHMTKILHCPRCPYIAISEKSRPAKPQILFGIQSVPELCTE